MILMKNQMQILSTRVPLSCLDFVRHFIFGETYNRMEKEEEKGTYVSNKRTVTCVAAFRIAKCSLSAAGCKIFAPGSFGV